MRRERGRGHLGIRTGGLLVGVLALCGSGCGKEAPTALGVSRAALLNGAGAYVATAESTASGSKLNGTTYVQTQNNDGVDEQLAEKGANAKLTHTWTIGSVSGTAFTLTVKAKKLETSGDSFDFGWGTSSGGPFTTFCTVGTADTSYKTCTQAVTVAGGTTTLYVQVKDSTPSGDSTTNKLNVDYVAAVPGGGGVCGNGTVETGEACDLGAGNGQPGSCCTAACAFVAAGTSCRAAAGDCDVAETCSGTSATCPTDAKRASGYVCRAATDACDLAEVCNGSSVTCPADAKAPSGHVCRAATGPCDLAEVCNGTSATCPADARVPAGTTCNDGQACTTPDACDGAGTCTGTPVTACAGGDGCCPPGCTHATDADCTGEATRFVATAESTGSGSKLNDTTYVQTHGSDGVDEELAEGGAGNNRKLTHTWTIGGITGTSFALTVRARKLEGSGDSFDFGWGTSSGGPFTTFCSVGTADTSYKACTQAVTVPAGTTALYVQVTDSTPSGDSTINHLNVDYLVAASGVGGCGNGAPEAGEQCDQGDANGTVGSCCTGSCAFVAAGTMCHPFARARCTGSSGACPASVTPEPDVVVCP